jgi:hypothetical protein
MPQVSPRRAINVTRTTKAGIAELIQLQEFQHHEYDRETRHAKVRGGSKFNLNEWLCSSSPSCALGQQLGQGILIRESEIFPTHNFQPLLASSRQSIPNHSVPAEYSLSLSLKNMHHALAGIAIILRSVLHQKAVIDAYRYIGHPGTIASACSW